MNNNGSPRNALRVLVVEDSAELQLLLAAMLHEIPSVHVVANVSTEEAAIDALSTTQADLAIVDLELASGTGFGVLKSMAENEGDCMHLTVVVFSNYANPLIKHRCLCMGAKAFFDKSFQIDELLEFVQGEAFGKSKSHSLS